MSGQLVLHSISFPPKMGTSASHLRDTVIFKAGVQTASLDPLMRDKEGGFRGSGTLAYSTPL